MPIGHDRDSGDALLQTSFGRCVAQLREEREMTIAELARRSGMARSYLWRLEGGEIMPTLRTMARIALALQLPMTDLVGRLDMSEVVLGSREARPD